MSEHAEVPARDEVATRLRELIAGSLTPEAASDWARPWVTQMDEVDDVKVQDALEALAVADMPTTDRPYLYGRSDFERWLRDLTA